VSAQVDADPLPRDRKPVQALAERARSAQAADIIPRAPSPSALGVRVIPRERFSRICASAYEPPHPGRGDLSWQGPTHPDAPRGLGARRLQSGDYSSPALA